MSTTTLLKPETFTFPDTISTEKQSLKFMKKMMAIAVSTISYLRFNLPDEAFVHLEMDNVKFVLLSSKSKLPLAVGIMDRLKAAMDALEKGYLKDLLLYIYHEDGDTAKTLESYKFTFEPTGMSIEQSGATPTAPGNSSSQVSEVIRESDFKMAGKKLLRRLIFLTQNFDSLPKRSFVAFKTAYHSHTPDDYHPPGFVPASPLTSLIFATKTTNDNLGKVSTAFHTLKGEVTWPAPEETPKSTSARLTAAQTADQGQALATLDPGLSQPFSPILVQTLPQDSVPEARHVQQPSPGQSPDRKTKRTRSVAQAGDAMPLNLSTAVSRLGLKPANGEKMDEFKFSKKIKV